MSQESNEPTKICEQPEVRAPGATVIPDPAALAETAQLELGNIDGDKNAQGAPEKEEQKIERDRREESELRKKELINIGLEADIEARKTYANRIYRLIFGWLIAILVVLLLHGFLAKNETTLTFSIWHYGFTKTVHFELSDPVLLALIGGTTASVLGLFVIVANYFFPKRRDPASE